MNKKLLASACTILAAALCGCSTIDKTVRVEGWPELKVVEHELTYKEMYRACRPYISPFDAPLACTVFYLDAGEAHIYVAKGLKFGPVLRHERLHAAGYDHVGSHSMEKILAQWKARKAAEEKARQETSLGDKLAHSNPADYAGW